jgi:hypothetical protein
MHVLPLFTYRSLSPAINMPFNPFKALYRTFYLRLYLFSRSQNLGNKIKEKEKNYITLARCGSQNARHYYLLPLSASLYLLLSFLFSSTLIPTLKIPPPAKIQQNTASPPPSRPRPKINSQSSTNRPRSPTATYPNT